jgi:hypothetical protein
MDDQWVSSTILAIGFLGSEGRLTMIEVMPIQQISVQQLCFFAIL